ncbi:hypothetical protein TorRG33x02_057150 [Trema orientale]|uniref:Uncharacterized protein n=1 Tax=Trema orientale TaxID=63057 RepID=A0A2P5FL12_TREOI|nr:hypothetical protein TorRG33x02_057150 [Trema orientale]
MAILRSRTALPRPRLQVRSREQSDLEHPIVFLFLSQYHHHLPLSTDLEHLIVFDLDLDVWNRGRRDEF